MSEDVALVAQSKGEFTELQLDGVGCQVRVHMESCKLCVCCSILVFKGCVCVPCAAWSGEGVRHVQGGPEAVGKIRRKAMVDGCTVEGCGLR